MPHETDIPNELRSVFVHLHRFLEPAVGAVDAAAVSVNHLFGEAHFVARRRAVALWRVTMQCSRRRRGAVQTQHQHTALDRVQIGLVRLVCAQSQTKSSS